MSIKKENQNVLVLGDCASNGNNALGHLVYDNPHAVLTFSLQYHKKFDDIVRWFLRERKNGKFLDKKISIKNLNHVALKTLREEEKNISWPNLLNFNVTNRSINGNHFCNYILQLEKYCETIKNPDLVLITDYTPSHMVVYFTEDNKKYKFLCEPHAENEEYDYHKHRYPRSIHQKKLTFIKKQNSYSLQYQNNKTRRYLSILENKLHLKNIPYLFVLLREENRHFFSPNKVIDLTDIKSQWDNGSGGEYESGEISELKYNLQSSCAKKVEERIQQMINNIN